MKQYLKEKISDNQLDLKTAIVLNKAIRTFKPYEANAGHEQLFAIYKDLLPFIRTQVVGDFTAARVNDSAWADGKLVLEEATASSLAKQADDLLAAIN